MPRSSLPQAGQLPAGPLSIAGLPSPSTPHFGSTPQASTVSRVKITIFIVLFMPASLPDSEVMFHCRDMLV